jgi:cell division septum initiation protein DivIVA
MAQSQGGQAVSIIDQIADERDKAQQENKQLKNRIKRLEEQLMDSKNEHAVLVADVVLNEDRAERIKRLETLGHELRECARQLGWTSSDDSRWIERAESAVKAWDKEAKL